MMTIRPYTPSDCPHMAALFYDTVHTVTSQDYTPAQQNAWAAGQVDLAQWNRSFLAHRTVVAEEDGILVGFGDMDETGYLDRLYVHRDYQRRGIATAICDNLERCVSGPITTHASITARPFFEKRGYRVVRPQQVERRGVLLTNYVMILKKPKNCEGITMKKAAICLSLMLWIGLLSGCAWNAAPDRYRPSVDTVAPPTESLPEETAAPTTEEPESLVPFSGDELYAVAYLGFQDKSALREYDQYLPDTDLPTHYISGGDYYLIIPRYSGMTLALYRNDMEASPTLLYQSEDCGPFLLQCNISDIFPDVTIRLTYQGETVEFSPYLSLKDGSVQIGDRGLDLTLDS